MNVISDEPEYRFESEQAPQKNLAAGALVLKDGNVGLSLFVHGGYYRGKTEHL